MWDHYRDVPVVVAAVGSTIVVVVVRLVIPGKRSIVDVMCTFKFVL